MTEIRIRHELDLQAPVLGDIPLDQIDTVIPTIKRWGLTGDDGNINPDRLSGVFRYDAEGNEAYFEVMIEAEPSDD
ncbi:hypothetical protein [Gordonia sp. (in: high G+C Gram-positive bacteria)]|uniref:hypothetical protein n=1 Tax=Gordonia sp. (in: high G+C Gram-positive bacteria) TaxID=84139 RepID=UPI003342495B